jgi:hypothetical protein
MRRICLIASFSVFALVNGAYAQGKGHGGGAVPGVSHVPGGQTPGATHSDAPAGTPAASSDRDKGKDRAEDVGKGDVAKGKDKGHKKNKKHVNN